MFEESGVSKIDLSNWQKTDASNWQLKKEKGRGFVFRWLGVWEMLCHGIGPAGKGRFQYVGFMMGSAVLWRGDMGHSTNLSLATSDLT